MTATIKTTIHNYHFDLREPAEKAEWLALKAKLQGLGLRVFESHGGGSHYNEKVGTRTVELETAHLFENQWNTAPIPDVSEKGMRVFDWALDYQSHIGAPPFIKRGHWLEQTGEMSRIRRNTMACGYCGKQENKSTAQPFCRHCLGSEYLTEKDLPQTRMQPVCDGRDRKPLTEAERAERLPLFREAQIHGRTEADKARIAKARASLLADYDATIRNATTKRDAMLWLMDRGIKTDNVIFYSHTGRFSFGWRTKLDADTAAALLAVISEFSWPYDLLCADGRTLSGN